MKINRFVRKNYHWLILTVLLVLIILVNGKSGYLVTGLDSIFPFFNSSSIISKAFDNNGLLFPSFAPMIPLLPVWEFMKSINIPIWAINQSFIFGSLALGIFGAACLAKEGYKLFNNQGSKIAFLVGGVLYLANLCTAWIFNQANYFFIASYATVPWMILILYYHGHKAKFNFGIIKKGLFFISEIIVLLIFAQASLNLSVFFLYLAQIFLVSALLLYIREPKNYTKTILRLILLMLSYVLAWFGLLQLFLIINGNTQFIWTIYINFYRSVIENPITESISADLRASGYIRNSILNNLMFNNSWMEAHTSSNSLLFAKYSLYTYSAFKYLLLIPFVLTLHALRDKVNSKKILLFHGLILLSLILMSNVILKVTEDIPLLKELFRWSGSKFWIILLIPIMLIASTYLSTQYKKSKTLFTSILILICISVLPIVNGNLLSNELTIKLPNEYYDLNKNIDLNKDYYYLPSPQSTYFYEYEFGYFGSDFVGYLTDGDYTNTGVISYFNNYQKYKELEKQLNKCSDPNPSTLNIIYDKNIMAEDNNNIYNCLGTKFNLLKKLNNIEIYESK